MAPGDPTSLETAETPARTLEPLAYHRAVIDYLKREEPEVWAWASGAEASQTRAQETRGLLLRDTYRLTDTSHAAAYEALGRVMQVLEVEAPATLYQASGGGGMNASLVFIPGEVHLMLQGPMLERLSPDELTALLGHEVAHYRLWSRDGGEVYTADRILQQTCADGRAAPSHYETARLFSLHTEVYADRGGALAAGAIEPAIATLVKTHTEVGVVDPADYLRQAEEIEAAGAGASQGASHPELFLRAQALQRWWSGADDLEPWMRRRLRGPLVLAHLDLPGQIEAMDLTRKLIAAYFARAPLGSERQVSQAKAYFPDRADAEAPGAVADFTGEHIGADMSGYFASVLLDLALCDPEVKDEAVLAAGGLARDIGAETALLTALRADAKMTKREVDALARKLKAPA